MARQQPKRRRRSIVAASAVLAGSLAATVLLRRRGERSRPHVGLYFEDGSMISLPETSPQAAPLVELGRETVASVRDGS